MLKRWLFYLAVLLGSIIFWVAHQGWVARLLMTVMFWLPWFSLAISLVPMLRAKPVIFCPERLKLSDVEHLDVKLIGKLPMPPYRFQLTVCHSLTGEVTAMAADAVLPTAHCGELLVRCTKLDIYDYLGLFRIRRKLPPKSVLVYPNRLRMDVTRELERVLAHSWQPKPGGFAENHELRLFRPGDSLNQIHWKLSAKTGKLTIRQPMVPRHGKIQICVDISGTPEELDRKMGRILWLGEHFLELGLNYELQVRCSQGIVPLSVACEADFKTAFGKLLRCSPADGDIAWNNFTAPWCFLIGGEIDEA